jgi:hypothetical protein
MTAPWKKSSSPLALEAVTEKDANLPSAVDLPRSEPEAELLPPETKNPTGREYSFPAMAF